MNIMEYSTYTMLCSFQFQCRIIDCNDILQVLIHVKAFGLNRLELMCRQSGHHGTTFPRILGIEAVGIVEESKDGNFSKGDIVATAMGGLGIKKDGSYAEYACIPAKQLQVCTHTCMPSFSSTELLQSDASQEFDAAVCLHVPACPEGQ